MSLLVVGFVLGILIVILPIWFPEYILITTMIGGTSIILCFLYFLKFFKQSRAFNQMISNIDDSFVIHYDRDYYLEFVQALHNAAFKKYLKNALTFSAAIIGFSVIFSFLVSSEFRLYIIVFAITAIVMIILMNFVFPLISNTYKKNAPPVSIVNANRCYVMGTYHEWKKGDPQFKTFHTSERKVKVATIHYEFFGRNGKQHAEVMILMNPNTNQINEEKNNIKKIFKEINQESKRVEKEKAEKKRNRFKNPFKRKTS
jgi:hypothetical protein